MRKLSIGIAWTGDNTEQVIRDAKIADEAGVDSLFVAETWGHDAFTLLTLLARETRRIKLGTAIVNIYSRSPGALAQHFATLDQLSGGRMQIGLGTSGPNVIEHFHGVKFEKPFTRTREYVEIINLLLRQEKLNYDGEVFKLARGFTLRFTPVRPHIPIWIASITPKSVKQTAAIADGWLPIFLPKARWKEQLGLFADAVRAAGRKPDVLVRCPYTVSVTDNPGARGRDAARNGGLLHRTHGQFLLRALRAHGLRGGGRRRTQGLGGRRLRRQVQRQCRTSSSINSA